MLVNNNNNNTNTNNYKCSWIILLQLSDSFIICAWEFCPRKCCHEHKIGGKELEVADDITTFHTIHIQLIFQTPTFVAVTRDQGSLRGRSGPAS